MLRAEPGVSLEPLNDARVFARPVPLDPVDPPRPESVPAAATDGTPDPLVQKIVVIHNGRIAVGTSPQGGATLQIVLPLSASA